VRNVGRTHLLRESLDLSEKFEEAIPLQKALKEIYDSLTKALESDPPPQVHWMAKNDSEKEVL